MSSNYETKDSATPLAETNVKNVTESSKDAPSSEATSGCIDNDPVSHSQNTQDLPKSSISGQGNSKVSVQNSENEDEFDDPNLDDDEMVTVTNLLANEIELLNKLEEDEEVSILGQRNNSKSDDISSNNPDEVIDLNDSGSINIGVDNELDESKLLMDTDEEMVNDTEQPFDSTDQIESPKRTLKDPNIMLEIPVDLDLSDDDCPLRESWNIFNKKSKSSPDNIAVIDNNIHKGDSSNNVESLLHKSVKDEELTLDHEVPIPKKEKPLVVEVIELLEDDDITEPEDIPKKKLLSEEEELQNAVQGIEADMREPSVDIITCVSILKDPSENIVQGQESCEIKENIETKCLLEHEHENTYLKDSADVVNDVSNNVVNNFVKNEKESLSLSTVETENLMISETLHKTYESLQDVDTEKDIKDSEVEISDKTKENSDQDKMEDIIDTTIKQLAEDLASPKKCTVGTQDIKCILNATTSSTNNLNYSNNESSLNIHSKMTSFQSQFTEEATMPESNNVNKFKDSAKTDATETRTDDIEPKPSTSKLTNSGELSTESSKPDVIKSKPTGNLLEKDVSAQPSTSTTEVDMEAVDKLSIEKSNSEAPSASKETDEGIEQNTSDSLGLLAESSRIVVDDEDQEEEEDGDDEEEFDPDDESSNQMTIDQSEDSNTHQFESEVKKSAAGDKIDEIGDRPFEFNKDNNDETTEDNIHDIVNENEDEDEVTVEAQDSIDIVDHDEKETELAESRTSPEPSSNDPETGVVNLDSEDESQDISEKKANVTSVNLPADIDVIASHSMKISTEIQVKAGEIIISGLTKPSHVKVARLNTSEISITTKKIPAPEVYDLDSEDEMETDNRDMPEDTEEVRDIFQSKKRRKCVNDACPKLCDTFLLADNSTMSFYNGKNRHYVCEDCAYAVHQRNEKLIEGIRNLEDLLSLDFGRDSKDPIEVLDSDSDEEVDPKDLEDQIIGVKGAKFVEEELVVMINEQWEKYKMDSRLLDSVEIVKDQMAELERQSTELDNMLKECQISTDKFRNELYATFQPEITSLPAISIVDTPITDCVSLETTIETRQSKRRMSSQSETPPKRRLTQSQTKSQGSEDKDDDNTDITVVQLSTEEAPPDLPPAGEIKRPPLVAGMPVFVMRNMFGTWQKSRIVEFLSRGNAAQHTYTTCRIKFDRAQKNSFKVVTGRYVAYSEPANARMTIGTRVIALFQGSTENEEKQRETYYSGVVAEIPNPVNKFRYLIFFDDGYAQYASHANTRLVCEYSVQVWDEVHPFSRSFVKEYLLHYPQRPMVRLRAEQVIRTEWNDKWWKSKVIKVDASLVLVKFLLEKNRDRLEWIYRGSTRLEPLYLEMKAAERHRSRAMPRAQAHSRLNMPIVEYTRSDDQIKSAELQNIRELNNEEIRRQRAVAKKSTSAQAQQTPPPSVKVDFNSRVVYYTPKNAVRPFKITDNHICSPACKRKDVLALKELRTYNPLSKPLLSGWERQLVRSKNDKRVMYRAPCGRRIRNMDELLRYLQTIQSDMGVDLFDFGPSTHCLAEFIIDKFIVSKKDLSHGKENVPVPCVNYYDSSLPEFCSYNTERTPTAGVPLNLNPEFLCGCDCEGDCEDKSKCACWKMTLEGARTIGLEGENVGYAYKRLPEPLPSGIYECNSRCKCKSTCMNRVAQHPLQLKLQVFKTLNRGWGIRALNDVPKGSFLCIYAGNLLTDATANLDGLNEGDEYLAELDYIEVVEQMKEGYEEDIPESIKALDKKESDKTSEESESEEEEESEEEKAKNESEDDDFKPAPRCVIGGAQFNKRLRKRKKEEKKEKKEGQNEQNETAEKNTGASCITISDDEEVREPSRFNAASEIGENNYVSKYKSVRTLFGEDEACYIMDAKVQGNIGRYLNHSCCPNVFVQNVFVDTHDPRFPWVAFFALTNIKAGKELTWNYNYDVGSVPGKVLYCHCGEPNCRGRLL